MRSFLTILKILAVFAVVGILVGLFLMMQKVKDEFGKPVSFGGDRSGLLDQEQMSDFVPGQREFNRALELIALGDLEGARERLLFIQNLFPNSMNGPAARRILGEMNLDELLSVENMSNKAIHQVRPGEAYLSIARRHDTTIDCLMFLNGMTELDTLHPGDEFIVMGLYFSLEIDVGAKRITVYRMDEEKKQKVFLKEYKVVAMDLPRLPRAAVRTKIALKRGEADGKVFSPMSEGYRASQKVLMLDRPALQIRPVRRADEADPGSGFFLKEADMEELALLMRLGNEVELIPES